jgi:hypothetical protein
LGLAQLSGPEACHGLKLLQLIVAADNYQVTTEAPQKSID